MAKLLNNQTGVPLEEHMPVWRYLSFSKFAALIIKSEIFMSRADRFEDLFEGAISKETLIHIMEKLEPHFKIKIQFALEEKDRNPASERDMILKWFRNGPPHTFINCWYLGGTESDAMWKVYGETNDAVAIKSTVGKLSRIFPDDVVLLPVQYLEPGEVKLPDTTRIWQFAFKRPEFSFESELRCVKFDFTEPPEYGHVFKISNLNDLIEQIVISPKAPYWLRETVISLISRFDLNLDHKKVTQSNMSRNPWEY